MADLNYAIYKIEEKGILDSYFTDGYVNDIVEALKKQIPLPPFNKEFPNGSIVHYCPNCREEFELHPNFCDRCGQSIDWSD